jgi:hypothetical protein
MVAATFIAIAGQSGGIGRMVAQINDPDGEFLASWVMRWTPGSPKWAKLEVRWIAASLAMVEQPKLEVAAMGPEGTCVVLDLEGNHLEYPAGAAGATLTNGFIREIRRIGGSLFACGMGRQVYRREASGAWSPAHQGVLLAPGAKEAAGFNSIHGMMEDDLWTVGFLGEIWRCRSGWWAAETSPTNVALNKILVVNDRLAFIAGKAGTLLRYDDRAGWAVLPQPGLDVELWDLAWFRDRLFVATGDDLLALDANAALTRVADTPHGITHLSVSDDTMWAISPKQVIWTRDAVAWNDVTPPI